MIELLAAGTRAPAWVEAGVAEYGKRLGREWRLDVKEIPVARRNKGAVISRLKQQEGERMLGAVRPGARVVALDRGGAQWTTEQLAGHLDRWLQDHRDIHFLIGGPDGLADECLAKADDKWSLSTLTFPHFLVRVLVAEQVYRAWSVVHGHPYHK